MQRAFILAPSPLASDGSGASDAVDWLRAALAQRGFLVTVLDDTQVAPELASAGLAGDDIVLVHDAARPCLRAADLNRLLERLQSRDVHLTLIKDGDHRLSRDQDLALLARTIADLSD